jgi:hypothetical protein
LTILELRAGAARRMGRSRITTTALGFAVGRAFAILCRRSVGRGPGSREQREPPIGQRRSLPGSCARWPTEQLRGKHHDHVRAESLVHLKRFIQSTKVKMPQ